MTTDPPTSTPSASTCSGALTWLLVLGLVAWSALVTFIVQTSVLISAWSTDLSKTALSAQAILAFGLLTLPLVGLPALVLFLLIRDRRPRAVARTILLATVIASILMIPRLVFAPGDAYVAGLTRVALSLAIGVALLLWAGRRGGVRRSPGSGFTLALLLAALLIWPWFLYGALGDGVDVALAAAQAISLAVLCAGLAAALMPDLAATSASAGANTWLGGFTLAAALLAIAASWGQMDYQALLGLVLPALGFPLALFGARAIGYDVWSAIALVALTSFGPLAFADPRETVLVGILSNDTAQWSMRAALIDLLIGWLLVVPIGLFAHRLLGRGPRLAWGALAAVAWAGGLLLFFTAGQPGFYGDDFFVVLNNQADLSPAYAIADVDERRAWVYETLAAQADADQAELVAWLDAKGIPYTRYYLVNGIEVQAPIYRRWQIARRPEVDRILYSPRLRPLPEAPALEPSEPTRPEEIPWGIEAIGAPRVWDELGVTGEGVVVGQSDSGADPTHPALASTYRGRDGDHTYDWFDPWTGSAEPFDGNGHGTHTLGTVLGQDGIGVAPGAAWFACANLVRNLGNPANYLDCMQFMLAPHPSAGDPLHDGRPDLAADVSTNSWGCPPSLEGCDQLTLWQATQALRAGWHLLRGRGWQRRPGLRFPGDAARQLRQRGFGRGHRCQRRYGYLLQPRAEHPSARRQHQPHRSRPRRRCAFGLARRGLHLPAGNVDGHTACSWRGSPDVVGQSRPARRYRRHRAHPDRDGQAL